MAFKMSPFGVVDRAPDCGTVGPWFNSQPQLHKIFFSLETEAKGNPFQREWKGLPELQ